MSLLLEPNVEQIKEQKLYRDMGLTDEEFANVEQLLGRTLTIQKQAYSLLCGQSTVAIKTLSLY